MPESKRVQATITAVKQNYKAAAVAGETVGDGSATVVWIRKSSMRPGVSWQALPIGAKVNFLYKTCAG